MTSELQALPKGSISDSEKGWQYGFDLMIAAWENSYGLNFFQRTF